jgi:hypothetical protein
VRCNFPVIIHQILWQVNFYITYNRTKDKPFIFDLTVLYHWILWEYQSCLLRLRRIGAVFACLIAGLVQSCINID